MRRAERNFDRRRRVELHLVAGRSYDKHRQCFSGQHDGLYADRFFSRMCSNAHSSGIGNGKSHRIGWQCNCLCRFNRYGNGQRRYNL